MKEIEMHKAESSARDEKLALFVFFFNSPIRKEIILHQTKWMFRH